MRRDEPVLTQRRVEHTHQCRAAAAHGEHQVRQRRAGQLLRIPVGYIISIDVAEIDLQIAPPIQESHAFGRPHFGMQHGG
jgi:hypothetical protein